MHLYQLTLVIVKSPEEYIGNKHLEIPKEGGSLGRDQTNTVSLIDHDRFISSSHCLINIYGDTYYLSDVSTNGTLINGNKLVKNQPVSLYDGDTITLGRYDISVQIEKLHHNINIAADISEDNNSSDPLANLAEYNMSNEHHQGDITELLTNTHSNTNNNLDPVAHLNITLNKDDDLLRDEEESIKPLAHTSSQYRQLPDDNDSVFSEFEMPNLIPEDWYPEDFTLADIHQESAPEQPINKTPSIEEDLLNTLAWEEEPQLQPEQKITEKKPQKKATPTIETMEEKVAPHLDKTSQAAFCRGLGLNSTQIEKMNDDLFEQMGGCLRLCLEELQKKLIELNTLKENHQPNETTNIIELMISLHHQQLLAPNELLEQVFDELDNHTETVSQVTIDLFNQKLNILNPNTFAQAVKAKSRLKSKGTLWKEYLDFYALHNSQKIDISSAAMHQQIKEYYAKGLKI